MSALLLEIPRPVSCSGRTGASASMLTLAAAVAGALSPWLLLVGAHGGLARSAAACFAGPLPI